MNDKWTLFTFSRGDFKAVERYLNEQAEKGWELEKAGVFAKWKRTERTDLSYCVDLANPKHDRTERLDYVEFCAEGGWDLAAYTGQMYLFKSRPGSHAVPIHTDPELEKKNYNKYYIRNTILSIIYVLALIAMYALMGLSMRVRFDNIAADLQYGWMEHWAVGALYCALPVLGLLALWRIGHFIGALIQSRGEKVRTTPTWAMWVNSVLTILSLLICVLVLLGLLLDKILTGSSSGIAVYVVLFLQAALGVYRWAEIDKELFRGEKRRHLLCALGMIVMMVISIAADATTLYGEWTTGWFSWDEKQATQVYNSSCEQPLVHTEDVGLSFDFLDGGYVDVEHKLLPVGEWWKLGYSYPDGMPGDGLFGLSSVSVRCFGTGQAERMAEALANGMGVDRRYAVWPESGLEPVELDWADEAWYAELTPEGVTVSFLVVRVDDMAARLIFPTDLMSAENLAAIRSELSK